MIKPIQLPVQYDEKASQLVDAEGCAWLDVDALDYEDRDICVAMVKQITGALNATAREARLVEALEHYRFKCERGYCGHAHRDELPKCHVEGCECVSLDNRAAAALAEAKRITEGK